MEYEGFTHEQAISIHTLRVEGDLRRNSCASAGMSISIHTLRVEGDGCRASTTFRSLISIHTLRVEGDSDLGRYRSVSGHFNPHPPRGG